jgi:shikimate kinase
MLDLYKPIILIGFMASGKTTIGKRLAEILGRNFVDTDVLIEEKEGLSISEIFKRYGEGYFRDIEEKTILTAIEDKNTVIATGGGCVTRERVRKALKDKGLVFWLKVSPEAVLSRTADDNTRPLLEGDRETRVRFLLFQRESLYRETADYTIDATKSPEDIINEILGILEREA